MKHRIGYIGYGGMGGGYHWEVAHDRKDIYEDMMPVAVYDVRESQRKLAEERGMKSYDNFEDFIAHEDMDIVVVACANNFHCEMTCRALEAGKHVICEKPVAMCPEEFEKMVATAEKTGNKFFVHQNRRMDRGFLIVKKAFEEGRLGKITNLECNFTGGYMKGWRTFKDHAGGILYDWGVHLIDQLVYLVNEPVKSVYAQLRSDNLAEADDRTTVEFTFESGIHARVTVCGSFLVDAPCLIAYGDKGTIWVDDLYSENGTLRETVSSEWVTEEDYAYDENGAFLREVKILERDIRRVKFPDDGTVMVQDWAKLYKNMLDTIDGNDEMIVKYDQVRTVLNIIDAAFKSSETGKLIEF